MPTCYIHEKNIKKAEPREKTWFLWDSYLKGFGVQIQPTGTKSYVVRYIVQPHRKDRRMKLGRCNVLPSRVARGMARKILAGALQGEDALAEKRGQHREILLRLGSKR